ncbi:MAG: glycosyl transferase [Candidatus Omnitrophica bacterium]|nr:glycosyl transferase [Candidatus Omnitrophota bacterium]
MAKYGYFDPDNREFVITKPDTPTPWINYLGSEEYCALISNTAGGYSFHMDPKDKRITRFRYNNIPPDRPGRYIYLRDTSTGEYWSATWQPVIKEPQSPRAPASQYKYECRHGLGYTKIKSEYKGISAETTYFVPLGENVEFWVFKIANKSGKRRKLKIFTYLEFCLWHAEMDMTDFQYTLNIAKAVFEKNTIFHETEYAPKAERFNLSFFACTKNTSGHDCDRETFIGRYRSEENPEAVERGKSFNSFSSGGNPIASVSLDVKLGPGETDYAVFMLGVAEKKEKARSVIKKYRVQKAVFKKFEELKKHWNEFLGRFEAKTPDPEVDIMVNTWNPYQCRTTFNWSRFASYYEAGIGRGMGFRDSNQDTLGVVHGIPEKVKTRIKELASNQFKNGSSYHKFFPLTKSGEKGGYSDDPLWLILATAGYVKETKDIAFMKERVKYVDGRGEPMYEHLRKAIDFVESEKGPQNFTLMRFADWNDCLNLGTDNEVAETTWVPELHYLAIKEFIRLAELLKKQKDINKYKALLGRVKNNFNKKAWDGQWFIRGIDKFGKAVGSKKNKYGKIYLNTQTWAVMSGIAEEKRARISMDMVKKHLDTKHGIMLMAPAYVNFDPVLGAITTFAPGLKENGGIFCHSNPWAMIAETILGRGDRAFEYYKKILPPVKNAIADVHQTECYVYSQFITGRDNPNFGKARNSWLTGTAAWNMVAISQYILGIKPEYKGLMVDPCIPRRWKRFNVCRKFRNAIYKIEVRNPRSLSKGVKTLTVDGRAINGNIVPDFGDKKVHRVIATLGS